ncbi:MAG: hypothetical protein GX621_11075 [Pirellulaceae bacterium]|nr:hypothetical protein [Pirellulaceae bacterium]
MMPSAPRVVEPASPSTLLADLPDANESDLAPPRLMARLLATPKGMTLAGRPVSLFEALSQAQDASRQLDVVYAYWEAVARLGNYHVQWHCREFLDALSPRSGDEAALETVRAAAAATLAELEVAVVAAQYELTEPSSWTPDLMSSPVLPLPSDMPLVGPYNTRFDRVFAARPAPPRAELAQRTLPMREKAIAARAKAVAAAETALDAARRGYLGGSCQLGQVEAALARWLDQQSRFLRAACDYNREIAEYAVTVKIGPIDNVTFVTMLIGPQAIPEASRMAEGVVPVVGGSPMLLSPRLAPTPAPPRFVQPASGMEPLGNPPGQTPTPAAPPRDASPTTIPDWTPSEPLGRIERAPFEPLEAVSPPPAERPNIPARSPGVPTTPPESFDGPDAPKLPVVPVE